MDTQTNQPSTAEPVVVPPVEQVTPPVQPVVKSSNIFVIVLIVLLILALAGAGAYYFMGMKQTANVVTEEPRNLMVQASPEVQPSDLPLSSSDDIDAIKSDLDNTNVSDDSSLYTDIETDLQGL